MNSPLWLNILRNWKTSAIGLLATLLAVIQAANEPSLNAALHDPKLALPLLVAAVGYLGKDGDKTGVAEIPPEPQNRPQN